MASEPPRYIFHKEGLGREVASVLLIPRTKTGVLDPSLGVFADPIWELRAADTSVTRNKGCPGAALKPRITRWILVLEYLD